MLAQLRADLRVAPPEVRGVDLAVAGDDDRLDRVVSEASGAFALFGARDGLLSPTPLERRRLYTDDVVTIQKYQGKTNEQFTHLLLNVTAALSKRPAQLLDGTLHVLDPMCGRGTTLNTCLLRGLDITGIEELNNGTTPKTVKVTATKEDGSTVEFDATVRIDTPGEADYYRNGGILQYVLRSLVSA